MSNKDKMRAVMRQWKDGTLEGSNGGTVPKTDAGRRQAISIAMEYKEPCTNESCDCPSCRKKQAYSHLVDGNASVYRELENISNGTDYSFSDCRDIYIAYMESWEDNYSRIISPHERAMEMVKGVVKG